MSIAVLKTLSVVAVVVKTKLNTILIFMTRIQSFPENFKLIGSEHAQYRALGNAIAPVMFWYVANEVNRILVALKEKEMQLLFEESEKNNFKTV